MFQVCDSLIWAENIIIVAILNRDFRLLNAGNDYGCLGSSPNPKKEKENLQSSCL